VNRNDSQLALCDVPIFLWLFGILFAGIGVLILYEGGKPAIALALIAMGLGFLLFTSVLTITADGITRTLTLKYRSALRHEQKQVSFDEIAGINVERFLSSGKGGSQYTYRLALLRTDGQVIPFRSSSSSGWKAKERRAQQLREFIGIQETNRVPSGKLPMELFQSTEIRESNGIHWQIHPMTTQGSSAPTGMQWRSPDFKTSNNFLFLAQKAEGQSSTGFLASLGSMFFKQALSLHGFQLSDIPGLDQAALLAPLDPSLENHFMAYTNSPESASRLLNPQTLAQLADWTGRYPVKQFQSGSHHTQLIILFSPNGLYLVTLNLLKPAQAYEMISLGEELVKGQTGIANP
jgi:hypothetical protein